MRVIHASLLLYLALSLVAIPAPDIRAAEDIATLSKEGISLFKSGQREEGIARLERALNAAKKRHGEDHQMTVTLMVNLARMYALNNQDTEALALYEPLIEDYRQRYGENHLRLGTLYFEAGRLYGFGSEERREALEDAVDIFGHADSPRTEVHQRNYVRALYYLANSNLARHEVMKAWRLDRRAMAISEKHFGPDAAITGEAHFAMGQYRVARRQYKKAEREFTTAIDIWKETLPKTHPSVLAAHAALVGVYEEMGESDKATKHCVTVGKLAPLQEGEDQPLYRIAPEYPRMAQLAGVGGHVVLDFTVTPEGRVSNVRVTGGERESMFKEAAIEAIKDWRYKPRVVDGAPVPSERQFKMSFEIKDSQIPTGSRIRR